MQDRFDMLITIEVFIKSDGYFRMGGLYESKKSGGSNNGCGDVPVRVCGTGIKIADRGGTGLFQKLE